LVEPPPPPALEPQAASMVAKGSARTALFTALISFEAIDSSAL